MHLARIHRNSLRLILTALFFTLNPIVSWSETKDFSQPPEDLPEWIRNAKSIPEAFPLSNVLPPLEDEDDPRSLHAEDGFEPVADIPFTEHFRRELNEEETATAQSLLANRKKQQSKEEEEPVDEEERRAAAFIDELNVDPIHLNGLHFHVHDGGTELPTPRGVVNRARRAAGRCARAVWVEVRRRRESPMGMGHGRGAASIGTFASRSSFLRLGC